MYISLHALQYNTFVNNNALYKSVVWPTGAKYPADATGFFHIIIHQIITVDKRV